LEISVWKRLWTCRETDKYLNLNCYLKREENLWLMLLQLFQNLLTVLDQKDWTIINLNSI
jgi:hypothetical protein